MVREVAARRFEVVEDREVGGRHARLAHHVLCERLARFEPGCGAGWSKNGKAVAGELVHDSGRERIFGADHGQVYRIIARETEQPRDIAGRERDGRGDPVDTGIAAGAVKPAHRLALAKPPA
jgi:hypothetical protein